MLNSQSDRAYKNGYKLLIYPIFLQILLITTVLFQHFQITQQQFFLSTANRYIVSADAEFVVREVDVVHVSNVDHIVAVHLQDLFLIK